ncbi:MAG: PEP-CTERM sorting domain-containing protein [Planctomycetota bacterium]
MRIRLPGFAMTLMALCFMTSQLNADVFGDSGENGVGIPDNTAGVDSTVSISQNEVIQDASFSIEGLNHSWIGDLIITVSHSTSGKSATLMQRVGTTSNPNSTGDSSDMNGTYTFNDGNASIWTAAANGDTDFIVPGGTYDASGANESLVSLNDLFVGESTQGVWTFNVSDNNETQTGSFIRTSVSFVSVVPEPGTYAAIVMSMLVGGVLLRRRQLSLAANEDTGQVVEHLDQ